jgi:hypothetical protein
MSNVEAIGASMRVAGKFHLLYDHGVVRESMSADLVLLVSDPLVGVRNPEGH